MSLQQLQESDRYGRDEQRAYIRELRTATGVEAQHMRHQLRELALANYSTWLRIQAVEAVRAG